MNYNTVYVGMDVHKESFSLCAYTIETEKASHYQKTEVDYKNVLKYVEFLRTIYRDDANFICGYETGYLGYNLYHQLTANNIKCIILAPTTMLEQRSKKRIKTDKRDAEIIAKCLAQHNYSPVHIPTAKDEETKEFLRMRDDHKLALKKVPLLDRYKFYSHVICSGTKIAPQAVYHGCWFYSHVICSGTKMQGLISPSTLGFYRHVICSGTKIKV